MPCGDCGESEFYDTRERMSKVLWLHEELDTGEPHRFNPRRLNIHPRVQAHNDNLWVEANIDGETARLCARLSSMDPLDVLKCSLDLQQWWIQHQIFDRNREEGKKHD